MKKNHIPDIYTELSAAYNTPTTPIEKIQNTLALVEQYKLAFEEDKEFFTEHKQLIGSYFDKFFADFQFDSDDAITIKSDLGLYSDPSPSALSTEDFNSSSPTSTDPMPEVKVSILTKIKQSDEKRKMSTEARSKITIEFPDGELKEVYFEHNLDKRYLNGCSARVKKVFDSTGNLIGAVKIFNSEILAKTEAKIAAFIPDRADKIFCGSLPGKHKKPKWYVFMPWLQGETLLNHCKKVESKKIANPPMNVQLDMIKQVFEQLKAVHDQGYTIDDIHEENLIISIAQHKLYLLDFAFSHLNAPLSQKNDIYNLGFTVSALFSERPEDNDKLINNLTFSLLKKMTAQEVAARPKIDECIKTIDQIIAINNLINHFLKKTEAIVQKDEIITQKKSLINHQAKKAFTQLKRHLSQMLGSVSPEFNQNYRLMKQAVHAQVNLCNRKIDRLRVTPIEELTATNPARFSWDSTSPSPKLTIPQTPSCSL